MTWHDQSALTLKPSSGGLEQLVTNFSSLRFSSSVKPSTTSQKVWMTGWVAVYPPEGHHMEKLKIPSQLYGGVNTPGVSSAPTRVVCELFEVIQANWHMGSWYQHLLKAEMCVFVCVWYRCGSLVWRVLCSVPAAPAGQTCAATPGWPRWPAPAWRPGSEAWSVCSACSRPPNGCKRCGLLSSQECLCLQVSVPPPGSTEQQTFVSPQ